MATETTTRPLNELNPDELQQERQRLAYEHSIGTPGAAGSLAAVEKQLGSIVRDEERATLAAKEAVRRAVLEAEQQAAAKRVALEAALEVELAKRPALCAKAEAQMVAVLTVLVELDAVSRAAYRITSELGNARSKLIIGERLGVWIQHRLSGTIDGVPRVPRELRQPLADLIGAK